MAAELISLTRKQPSISLEGNSSYGDIQGMLGSSGNDTITMPAGIRGVFVEAGAGNDTISLQFSSSVVEGGAGDDVFVVNGGLGVVTLFYDAGSDTLQFTSNLTRQQLVVRKTDGWIEIGINPANLLNITPGELDSWILISPMQDGSSSIESIAVGGVTYGISDILATSNHRPFITSAPEFHSGSAAGQPLGVVHGYDMDSSNLQYSVVGVSGWGHSHSWSIWNGQLYSSAPLPSYVTVSNMTIRVSDGKLYSDQKAMVHWSAQGEYVSHAPVYDPGFGRVAMSSFRPEEPIEGDVSSLRIWSLGINSANDTLPMI